MLARSSLGFGAVAALEMSIRCGAAASPDEASPSRGGITEKLHHPAKAKHVILCFMSGGVSHVDTFDPKPKLTSLHGQPMPVQVQRTQFNDNGNIMGSPFRFDRYGQCGLEVSEIFSHLGGVADELAVIRSMTTKVNEHAQGNFFLHTGFPFLGYPSAGAWCAYGLGSISEDLPAYVVLQSGTAVPPHGGVGLYSSGFLPAQNQGSILKADGESAIANIRSDSPRSLQRARLDLAQQFNHRFLQSIGGEQQVEAAIANYETAFRMQTAVPELCDLSNEPEATIRLYGIDSTDPQKAAYARQCLLARRLVEKGVRFVELSCLSAGIGAGGAPNPWDQHGDLERGHRSQAYQVDQPIAALIQDLRQRGLLDETLIIWAGEFGRTPFSQGSSGRDHNPFGFTIWLAGGGVRGGTVYGATDELGYYAVEQKCELYDLWATVLHQLGIDHHRLTFHCGGRDFRLTDVHGRVLTEIIS